jgi:hypothetical protein
VLFRSANDHSVKTQFPIVYQILDHAVDFGFPFLNEADAIRTVMTKPAADPARGHRVDFDYERPWRAIGIDRLVNELIIDVVETVDAIVSARGRLDFCHISGSVHVRSTISATPVCSLYLSAGSHFDDVVFHRCVQAESHEAKVIPFIPPDGDSVVMKYRVVAAQADFPIWVVPKFEWSRGSVAFEITLRIAEAVTKPIDDLEVRFELPSGVMAPTFGPTVGQVRYDISDRAVVWTIGCYTRRDPAVMKGNAWTEPGFEIGRRSPIVTIKYFIYGMRLSAVTIEKVEVSKLPHSVAKEVFYSMRMGSCEFRTSVV